MLFTTGAMMSDLNKFRLLVSIVNYKSAALVCNLLPGLISQLHLKTDRVVIVDNNSSDSSVQVLQKFIREHSIEEYVLLIPSDVNGGFSYGNNLAVKSAKQLYGLSPDYIWLLNPDTRLKDEALCNLIDFMDSNPNVGIAGSQLETEEGTPQISAFKFHTLTSEIISSLKLNIITRLLSEWNVTRYGTPTSNTQVEWVAGASMMIRHALLEQVGLMDENYFLYYEETDFCLQAVRNEWECWYVPNSRVIHFVGQSTGVVSGDVQRKRRPKYWFESRQYYYRKNHGLLKNAIADLIWGTGFAIWRIRRKIQNKPDNDPEHMLKDFWRNSIFLSWIK